MNITTHQIAKVIYRTKHESRRSAKRYLRENGFEGTAGGVDLVISIYASHAEKEAIDKEIKQIGWEKSQSDRKIKEDVDRQLVKRRVEIITEFAEGSFGKVATLFDVDSKKFDGENWPEGVMDYVLGYAEKSIKDRVIAILEKGDQVDWDSDLDSVYNDIDNEVTLACAAACMDSALYRLRSEFATKEESRYTVWVNSVYKNCVFFEELGDAEAYTAILNTGDDIYDSRCYVVDEQQPEKQDQS